MEKLYKSAQIKMHVISFLSALVFYGPIASLYRTSVGITFFQISIIEMVFLLLSLLLEVPLGYLADRIGYKKSLIISYSILLISKVVFYYASSFPIFLLERILLAISFSLLSGIDIAYLSKAKANEKTFSYYTGFSMLGLFVVGFSFYFLIDFKLSAFLTIISHAITLIIVLTLPEIENDRALQTKVKLKLKKFKPSFIFICLAYGIIFAIVNAVSVFIIQIRYEQLGVVLNYLGLFYLLTNLFGAFGAFLYSKTNNRGLGYLFVLAIALLLIDNLYITVIGAMLLCFSSSFLLPGFSYAQMKETEGAPAQGQRISISMIIKEGAEMITYFLIGLSSKGGMKTSLLLAFTFAITAMFLITSFNEFDVTTNKKIC